MPESWMLLLLFLSAFGAGVINSVAGGGTLLTFPALLSVMPAVEANITSTIALLPGSLASAWGYRSELKESRRMALWLLIPSTVGGTIGALLVTRFDPAIFARLVPWLVLTASFLFLIQRPIARWAGTHVHDEPKGRVLTLVLLFQFGVGVYGGYFGAGIGILMLAALGFMGLGNIHKMNSVKTLLASTINLVTVIVFVREVQNNDQLHINQTIMTIMAIAAILGGYMGARVARKLPPHYIRYIVLAVGFGTAIYAFVKQL
jgi:uncharacterized protein